MSLRGSEALQSTGRGAPAAPLRQRVAPHVFLVCFVALAVVFLTVNGLEARMGDTRYDGPLPDGEPVAFHAASGDAIDFRLEAVYWQVERGDQASTLTVRDPSGAVVWTSGAGFRVLPSTEASARSPDDVEPPTPLFHAAATGEHTVTWTYESGTPSENTVEVVANGYRVEGSRTTPGFAALIVTFVAGAVGLVGTRPTRPDATGWRRLWPVVGVSAASGLAAVVAGVALAALMVAYLGGLV